MGAHAAMTNSMTTPVNSLLRASVFYIEMSAVDIMSRTLLFGRGRGEMPLLLHASQN
jgi:hypothetical protein